MSDATYVGVIDPPIVRRALTVADLRVLADAVSRRAEQRMRDASTTVPGPHQWQSRGAGLALQDVAAAIRELAESLAG